MSYLIRGGLIADGSGGKLRRADVLVEGDSITALAPPLSGAGGAELTVIEADGKVIAPGFIDTHSHADGGLLTNLDAETQIRQGITTALVGQDGGHNFPLSEWFAKLKQTPPALNIASFIGHGTVRGKVMGDDYKRAARPDEIRKMRALVAQEVRAGGLGLSSGVEYDPGIYSTTEELIALCRAAAPYGGKYISHLRSEADQFVEAVEELMRISREAGVRAEIYHLKAAGKNNWHKLDIVIEMIEKARAQAEPISADMYLYDAGATGLSNAIPPKYHDGGPRRLFERLADPAIRAEIRHAIEHTHDGWENLYARCDGPDGILILGVRKAEHRLYQGKTLTQVASMMGIKPLDALLDLVAADRSRIDTAYFMIDEANVRTEVQLPWVSFGSDAASWAAEGKFLLSSTHPRAYGNFARDPG